MRNAFMTALFQRASEDKNVMLLTADLGYGVFEVFEEKFPQQFLNVGVAEQNMIGIAAGLALEGKIVFVYSIGNFPTLRCLEQIRNDACYHELNINIVAMGAGFSYGALGMSHHATEDISIMTSLPGVTVLSPCSEFEAEQAVLALSLRAGVGYLRIDKSKIESPQDEHFQIGKMNLLLDGRDCTIFVSGGIAEEALSAAELLLDKNISLKVISVPTIKPIDVDTVVAEAQTKKCLFTLEEGTVINGLGSTIINVCAENNVYPQIFYKFGVHDTYTSEVGSQVHLRKVNGINASSIANKIAEVYFE